VEISIDGAGCSHAAFGRRPEPAAYLLDFLLSHVTSAPANQYSVLIIHAYSPFVVGPVERARVRQKKFLRREWLYVGAAFAVESVAVRAGVFRSRGGAKGCGTYSSTDVLDFLLTQGTSALAKQYSVQVIHASISFRDFGPIDGPSFAKQRWAALTRSRTRLTTDLADVLISIRRRRGSAEGQSSKASIDEVGFRGCQLAGTPADQYSFFVIHVWFSFRHWIR
jgi:hypothetical protein